MSTSFAPLKPSKSTFAAGIGHSADADKLSGTEGRHSNPSPLAYASKENTALDLPSPLRSRSNYSTAPFDIDYYEPFGTDHRCHLFVEKPGAPSPMPVSLVYLILVVTTIVGSLFLEAVGNNLPRFVIQVPATRSPPAGGGFFSHRATDMPAVMSSKVDLTAILTISNSKAEPGHQVDLAWSTLTPEEEACPEEACPPDTDMLGSLGYLCESAFLTVKVFIVAVIQSVGVVVGGFLARVISIGVALVGMWLVGGGARRDNSGDGWVEDDD